MQASFSLLLWVIRKSAWLINLCRILSWVKVGCLLRKEPFTMVNSWFVTLFSINSDNVLLDENWPNTSSLLISIALSAMRVNMFEKLSNWSNDIWVSVSCWRWRNRVVILCISGFTIEPYWFPCLCTNAAMPVATASLRWVGNLLAKI